MKTKETPRGTEFITNNKFSKYLVSKDDRKLNAFLRFKYKLVCTFHLQRIVKKKAWFRTMEDLWNDMPTETEQNQTNDQVVLDPDDLTLERIVFYDLLPKERLEDYKEKYLKFRRVFINKCFFDRRSLDIKDSFTRMQNSYGARTWHNVDFFRIKDDSPLGAVYDRFHIEFISLTKSFYVIKYTLYVKASTNEFLERILTANPHKPAICISDGKWWKKNSFSGCHLYDMGDEPKVYALNDYILELKAIFFKEVKSKLLTLFHNWQNIIPSVEMYSSKSLDEKKDSIFSLLSFNNVHDVEKGSNDNVFFIPCDSYFRSENNSSKIIAETHMYEQDQHGIAFIENIDQEICRDFADYFILSDISAQTVLLVSESQLRINRSIYDQPSLNSLIRSKLKIDKTLYFYRRLYREYQDISHEGKIERYGSSFINPADNDNSLVLFGFSKKYSHLLVKIRTQSEAIEDMYLHFSENSKLLESKYNYRVVRWTLVVAVLTLIVTLLFANNGCIFRQIAGIVRELFDKFASKS